MEYLDQISIDLDELDIYLDNIVPIVVSDYLNDSKYRNNKRLKNITDNVELIEKKARMFRDTADFVTSRTKSCWEDGEHGSIIPPLLEKKDIVDFSSSFDYLLQVTPLVIDKYAFINNLQQAAQVQAAQAEERERARREEEKNLKHFTFGSLPKDKTYSTFGLSTSEDQNFNPKKLDFIMNGVGDRKPLGDLGKTQIQVMPRKEEGRMNENIQNAKNAAVARRRNTSAKIRKNKKQQQLEQKRLAAALQTIRGGRKTFKKKKYYKRRRGRGAKRHNQTKRSIKKKT